MDSRSIIHRRLAWGSLLTAIGAIIVFVGWNRLGPTSGRARQPQRSTGELAKPGENASNVTAISREADQRANSDDYVGSAACAQCHAQIADAFAGHPMAHSTARIDEAPVIEDYEQKTMFATAGGQRYRVERKGNRVWHHEMMMAAGSLPTDGRRRAAPDGEVLYDQAVEISHVIGSGVRGRTYLIDREGQFFASPITWYTKDHRWDLAPGYPPENHLRFERLVQEECLFCHSGRTSPAQPAAARYAEPPFREEAIGCERCHGPGHKHVDDQLAGRTESQNNATIVNPARLASDRRDSVCNQCHLHGEIRIPRQGKQLADFRPGQRLDEVLCVFVRAAPPDERGTLRAISQVEQMQASTCFIQSQCALGCISCHDPHRVPQPAERDGYFLKKCLNCHADRGCSLPEIERHSAPANDSCIYCHMPQTAAGGIPHAAQTDHRVQRRPSKVASSQLDLERLVFFDGGDQQLPEWEQARARGIMLLDLGSDRPDRVRIAAEAEKLLRTALAHMPNDLETLQSLGTACLRQSRQREALEIWENILERQPDAIGILLKHAVLCQAIGEVDRAAQSLERLTRLSPWQAEYHGRYAELLAQTGNWDRAIVEAERAVELDPTQIANRELLIFACERVGRLSESRRQRDILQKIQTAISH